MSGTCLSILLLGTSIGYVRSQDAGNSKSNERISISYDAVGYGITVMFASVIVVSHFVYWLTRLIKANTLNDNKVYLPEEGLTQRGFRRSWFGSCIKYSAFAFHIWLLIAMLMVIVGKYSATWPFDPTFPVGMVDAESYVRAFIASWIGWLTVAIIMRTVHRKVDSFYYRPCSLAIATHVKFSCVVTDLDDAEQHLPVKYSRLLPVTTEPCRHIDFLSKRYTWSSSARMFTPGSYFPKDGLSQADMHKYGEGLNTSQVLENLRQFGRNRTGVEVPVISRSLLKEMGSIFYVFQFSVCWLCMFFSYITYAIFIIILLILSAIFKVRAENRQLEHMTSLSTERHFSWVKRDLKWTKVLSEEVCVGDLVCLATDSVETSNDVAADMLIIGGEAVVDETALSGETIPLRKRSIHPDGISSYVMNSACRDFSLYAGTRVLQTSGVDSSLLPGNVQTGCLAIVMAIGGETIQAQLSRRLLVRKSVDTPYRMELFTAVTCLILVSFVEFLWVYETFGVSLDSVLPALTCVLGVFNPMLILAFLLPGMRSSSRLESSGIFVRSFDRIALAGKINVALMDKTGTITKKGLELVGLVSSDSPNMIDSRIQNIPWPNDLSMCVAMAHSVVSTSGKFVGDQVELCMVECSAKHGWKYDDIHAPTDVYGSQWEVLHTFPFNHESMCMSVVVRQKGSGSMMVLCKGSFEAIRKICSTISDDATQSTRLFSQEGHYVIAAATRELDRDMSLSEIRTNRSLIEGDLIFAGLILFSNEVKPDSSACIRELVQGGIECCIITGDSIATACSVAKSTGIVSDKSRLITGCVDHQTGLPEWRLYESDTVMSDAALVDETDAVFCITGDLYEILVSVGKLDLTRTKIYARFNPSQKGEIVRVYASIGKVVAVCGDSGNDTYALQAAHVSLGMGGNVSLSNASCFISQNDSLMALCVLVREGRASLCSTLSSYRFLVVTGIMQTFIRIILLTQFASYSTAVSNLVIECIAVPLLLIVMSAGTASAKLSQSPPEGSLMGPGMILGCVWSLLVGLTMYGIATAVLTTQSWYVQFTTDASVSDWSVRTNSFDTALAVIFRAWVCVDIAFAYSYGSNHRRSVIFNWSLVIICFILIGVTLYTIASSSSVWNCAVGINCTSEAHQAASDCPVNWFLFKDERIGGEWHGPIQSLVFPLEFRFVVLSLLMLMTIVHHTGFKFILLGRLVPWIHAKLGWTDMWSCGSCWRRPNPRGYKRLDESKVMEAPLDDSIMSASGDDSPTVEWHMRRSRGAWRVPEPLKYG